MGNQWTLGTAERVTVDQFWTWNKVDLCDADGVSMTGAERCTYFYK